MAPMTGLRIWKVGPAEILAILWCVINYKVYFRVPKKSPMVKFWPLFLSFALIGTVICQVGYREEGRPADMLTWLYMALISYAVYVEMNKRPTLYLAHMLKVIAVASAVVYLLLLVYAQNARTIFGARLWFGSRFTGGADNPHQLALLTGVVAVSSLWMFVSSGRWKERFIAVGVAVTAFFLLFQTQSSTALMATVAGYAIMAFETYVRKRKQPKLVRLVAFMLVVLVLLVAFERLWSVLYNWVASDSNGLGRFRIFASYPITFWKSPVFGLGPGVHGMDGTIEYHNAYLEVLAMSGIAGGIVFVLFTLDVLKEVKWSTYGVGMFVTLYMFGLAGFGMRRLIFWIILSIICAYSKRQRGMRTVERNGPKISKVISGT